MSLPAGYAKLLEVSRQMPPVARAQDWETLSRCESERGQLLATLPTPPVLRSANEAAALRICLQEIQDCDRQVLEYVLPWREQVGQLLNKLMASEPIEPATLASTPDRSPP
jgi:hypothetical protein